MVLAYGSRHSTRDIGALVIAPSTVREAAQRVADRNYLPATWLNDGVKGFSSTTHLELQELLVFDYLRVVMPPPEYILAMKCLAARVGLDSHDAEDVKFLVKLLNLSNVQAILSIVEKYYPKSRIPAKTQYFVEEICHELFS